MTYDFSYLQVNNKERLAKTVSRSYCIREHLIARQYKDAVVVPGTTPIFGGVIDSNGNLISQSCITEQQESMPGLVGIDQVIESNQNVIYIGVLFNLYGHFITDGLKKLWYLRTSEGKTCLDGGAKIAFLGKWKHIPAYMKEIFNAFDIDIDAAIHVEDSTRFKNVIIPDNSFIQTEDDSRYYTYEFKETVAIIKQNLLKTSTPVNFEKVYFTRTGIKSNREFGEMQLEILFRKAGYQIVSPEKLTIAEQINICNSCKIFATTEGSVAHNAIFLNPNVQIVILRKADYINVYQLAINEMSNLNITYIDAHNSFFVNVNEPWQGPFYICDTKYASSFFAKKRQSFIRRALNKALWEYLFFAEPASFDRHWLKPTFVWYILWYSEWMQSRRHKLRRWINKVVK